MELKKRILGMLFATGLCLTFAQESESQGVRDAPPEGSFVIDATAIKGKAKNDVRLVSEMDDMNVNFDVFYFDSERSGWAFYGSAFLRKRGDSVAIYSAAKGKLENIPTFAILARNKKDYGYKGEKRKKDFIIHISAEPGAQSGSSSPRGFTRTATAPALDKPGSFNVDVSAAKGTIGDYVRLVNATADKSVTVDVYWYDDKKSAWKLFGACTLDAFYEAKSVSSPLDGRVAAKVLAVVPRGGKTYKWRLDKGTGWLDVVAYTEGQGGGGTPSSSAYVFDPQEDGEKYDSVEIANISSDAEVTFDVFVKTAADGEWAKVGGAKTGTTGSSSRVATYQAGAFSKAVSIAVSPANGKSYEWETQKAGGTLFVFAK